MSNYVQTTFFAPKDSLLTGNPAKLIKGADVDPELAAISTAIASKYDATNISSAPVLFNDGTVAAPGIAFAADTNTGIYRVGADNLGIATGGVLRVNVASAGSITIAAPTAAVALAINNANGQPAVEISAASGFADARAVMRFTALKTSTQQYDVGVDTQGSAAKNFEIRDLTASGSPVRLRLSPSGFFTVLDPAAVGTAFIVNGSSTGGSGACTIFNTGIVNQHLVLNGIAAGRSIVEFDVNNSVKAYVGINSAAADLIPGSALNALCLRTVSSIYTSIDNGVSTAFSLAGANAATFYGTTAAFGGAASGYVVSPNYSFQNTGATNLAVRDTTDSTEGLFRADSTGIVFGAASNHSLFIRTNNATVISVGTAGGVQFGAPTGGDKGAGTLNVAGNLYVNNVAVSSAVGANPTATVGTAAVNGSSANFMRADGAPAINLGMVPTWTGAHVFSAASGVPVTISAASSGQALSLPAGTTTKYPVLVNSGTNLTTPVAGAVENDGTTPYFTPFATCRGVLRTEFLQTISAAYTLTSQTAAQKLLNATSTGAITLPIGVYKFECSFSLTSLSGTSGAFGFAFGGTATRTESWWYSANKTAGLPGGNGSGADGFCTAANVAISPTNTLQTGYATIRGVIRVTVAGTLIPQVSLGVAAAAVVGTDSFFLIQPVGPSGFTTVGQWT